MELKSRTLRAKNPAGNLLAEKTIQRVKTAIGGKNIEDAMNDILALNLVPQKGQSLSPFESMHAISSPATGIPMSRENIRWLTNRDCINKKLNSDITFTQSKCPIPDGISKDQERFTQEENNMDRHRMEKIKDKPEANLESGDRVYFVRRGGRGYNK